MDVSQIETLESNHCWVGLTHQVLDINTIMSKVRSSKAGAIVLFAGTTRDSFEDKTVTHLEYESYVPKALRTMLSIAKSIHEKHELTAIAMIHRLGTVPIGEDSIYIAVSSPHRAAAWRAGEEALERTKDDVEVWKKEEFEGEDGVWRANRDGKMGERIDAPEKADEERTNVQQNGGLHAPINDIGPDGERVIRPKSKFERGHGPVVHRQ